MKPQLISFKLCPFVQRSVIVLLEKQVDFDITYIDLKNPPGWFKAYSPLGKVPVLRVGEVSVFESAVIMEYLDEVHPPSLHPADPLRKAQHRAWIEFASTLFMAQFNMTMAQDEEAFSTARNELKGKLAQVEEMVACPFFSGDGFHLIDAAWAPLFMRLDLLERWHPQGLLGDVPKVNGWAQRLLERPSVRDSVVPELPELYRGHIGASGGYGARFFTG